MALPGQAVLAAAGGQNTSPGVLWMDGSLSKGMSQQGRGWARSLRKSSAETLSSSLQVSELNHNSRLEYLTGIYAAYINSAAVPTKASQLSTNKAFSRYLGKQKVISSQILSISSAETTWHYQRMPKDCKGF